MAVHGGRVFDGVEQTLAQLSRRFPLCIVSNCEDGYIQCFLQVTGLGTSPIFLIVSATGLSKGAEHPAGGPCNWLQAPIYVEIWRGDQQAARQAGVPFVFAQYWLWASSSQPDHTIGSMADLPGLLQD